MFAVLSVSKANRYIWYLPVTINGIVQCFHVVGAKGVLVIVFELILIALEQGQSSLVLGGRE